MARLQKETQAAVTTGAAGQPAFPARWATAYTRSPRGPALLPPSFASSSLRELGASTGTPGPHDFTVRTDTFVGTHGRMLRARTATAPRLTCRDDRDTPLVSRRDDGHIARFLKKRKTKIIQRGQI